MGGPAIFPAFAAGLVPAVVLAAWLFVVDGRRTPSTLVLQALALGTLIAAAVFLSTSLLFSIAERSAAGIGLGDIGRWLIRGVVVAPLIEEAARLSVLLLVLARHEDFRPTQFVVVAGWMSIGLAAVENVGYVLVH